jgi:hypothetical protein
LWCLRAAATTCFKSSSHDGVVEGRAWNTQRHRKIGGSDKIGIDAIERAQSVEVYERCSVVDRRN